MDFENWSDADLLDEFEEYDESAEIRLTDWEADFFDSLTGQEHALTPTQRAKVIQILREYEE